MALAREQGLDTVYVPAIDAREAALPGDVRVMPVPTLGALVAYLPSELPVASGLGDAGSGDSQKESLEVRPSTPTADFSCHHLGQCSRHYSTW